MSEQLESLPPHSLEAEKSLLGSMLRDVKIVPEVVGLVTADDFYAFANEKIYAAITGLSDQGKAADLETVAEWLIKHNQFDDVGRVYLSDLWDAAPCAANYQQYAAIIRERSAKRRLIRECSELQRAAFDPTTDAAELMADAERRVMAISDLGVQGEAVEIHVSLRETLERLDARSGRADGDIGGVPTGFIDLDNLLCGFQDSELIIIGARPSCGKTAFGLALARHAAVDQSLPVLFISLEQARIELTERLLCSQGRLDSHKLRRGHLSLTDQEDLMNAHGVLGPTKLLIDDNPHQTMLRIAANARRTKRRYGIRLIILDYLQLIHSDNYRASRQEQVADSSRRLKFLARELKVPIVVLAQVNRGVEDRVDKRPRLSDLRESGAIEQDADTVLLLHRQDSGDKYAAQAVVEVIVGKQRNGPTGEVSLVFVKKHMRFENAEISV